VDLLPDVVPMTAPNTLADFPADRFTLFGDCVSCGHSAPLWREHIAADTPIPAIAPRLRCRVCGARGGEIRIVYTAGPVFAHSGSGAGFNRPWDQGPEPV
jgi:hypothetical protein